MRDAYKLLSTSAKAGKMQSQFLIAGMYNDGIGVQRDKGQALYWCNLAEKNGHPNAEALRHKIHNVVQLNRGKE